ncbi:MAG: TonB-dependent receptor [Candidatus Omnitrophota bacterium]
MLNAGKGGLFFLVAAAASCFGRAYCGTELEQIVVTKSRYHLLRPFSLSAEDSKGLPFGSPVESLNLLPLDLASRSPKGGIQSDFSLRGSTFQGVLMLLNGERINDPQTAHYNCDIPLTSEDIERIEVLPGAGSSLFGPDAMGGAVNITLKKPEDKGAVLELKGGEHRTFSGLFSISEKTDRLGVRLSLENQESDGFSYDTDFKKFTTTLNSSFDIPDGGIDLNFGYQEKEYGAYDFYTPGLDYPSKEWIKTYLLNTGMNLDKDGLIIRPSFLWRRHYDKFALDKTQGKSSYLNHHRTDIYTPKIYLQKELGILGRAGSGVEYGEERINSTNLGRHMRRHESIFFDDSKELDESLSLGLSLRMDNFEGFDEIYSGSLNSRYKLSNRSFVHAGVSRSARVPSFTELYYNDPVTLGNASLSAEKSLNYQAGYDYKEGGLSFGFTLFYRREEDLIDWVKRSSYQAKWQVENIGEAGVFGMENYLRFRINPVISVDSNYSFINKRVDDQGYLYKYGPNYIKHLVNNAVIFKFPFGVQSIGVTYKKRPSRRGWLLLSSRLSYGFLKNSQIFLEATNILNVEYQEIEGIPQPGRWIEAGVRLEW